MKLLRYLLVLTGDTSGCCTDRRVLNVAGSHLTGALCGKRHPRWLRPSLQSPFALSEWHSCRNHLLSMCQAPNNLQLTPSSGWVHVILVLNCYASGLPTSMAIHSTFITSQPQCTLPHPFTYLSPLATATTDYTGLSLQVMEKMEHHKSNSAWNQVR